MGFASGRLCLLIVGAILLVTLVETNEARPRRQNRIRHHHQESHCNRCAPGFGLVRHCHGDKDTVCEICATGTYSPHHNLQPCWICSRCGPGLYEAHPCTGKHDTVCDSCHRHATDNPDYHRKCKGRASLLFLAPEDARSTGEESLLVNEPQVESILNSQDREAVLEADARADLERNQ